jgi:hypothetical protein
MAQAKIITTAVALPQEILDPFQDAQAQHAPEAAPVQGQDTFRPTIIAQVSLACAIFIFHLSSILPQTTATDPA